MFCIFKMSLKKEKKSFDTFCERTNYMKAMKMPPFFSGKFEKYCDFLKSLLIIPEFFSYLIF